MTRNLLAELRRRNVFRAAALYVGAVFRAAGTSAPCVVRSRIAIRHQHA